ncbi:MAG TPA: 4-hydroxyphenylacetate 3-hydroxylase N-terminal domain-containing protein [Candidatus Binatia bacterium]|nr:4-hydroxyphenylacetate 3-hydroxylase N-terminal domain-containing protein [Candidatus Binatia bacterium]
MRSGSEYIAGLRDRRRVYIDGELAGDVTTHPAFAAAVQSIAGLFDLARDPRNRELMTYPSPKTGEPVNRVYMIPRTKDDLRLRRLAIARWAEESFGFMGRTPDHVAGFFAGFASWPSLFARGGDRFAKNVVAFYERLRDEDLYATYTIVPPQIDRSKAANEQKDDFLYAGVLREEPDGIVIKGAAMLGTGSAISDWIFLSNIHPMKPGEESYAISVAVPCGAPGVRIYSRRSYAEAASSVFDYPLASRFDETDSLLVYDEVFVPWEHVFVYKNIELAHAQFYESPAHMLGNNQAQIRYAIKMKFIAGLARKIAEMTGNAKNPAVQGMVGEIAAHAALVEGLVLAQEEHSSIDAEGVCRPGQAELYTNMLFQSQFYPLVIDKMRELCGGGLIAADVTHNIPGADPSLERTKLMKLAWDAIGSEFAGRHVSYEMFYAGAPFITKGHMWRLYDWQSALGLVERALGGYDKDGRTDVTSEPQRQLAK